MTDEELDARFQSLEKRFDHLVNFMAQEFGAVRREMETTRQEFHREFEAVDRRLTLLTETTAALVKSNGVAEREATQVRGAIEDLDRRLRLLEQKNGSSQKP